KRVEAAGREECCIVVVEAVCGRSERRPLLDEVHAAQHHDASGRVLEPPTVVTEGHDPAVRDGTEPRQQRQATSADEGNDDGDDEAAHPSHDIGDPVAAPLPALRTKALNRLYTAAW